MSNSVSNFVFAGLLSRTRSDTRVPSGAGHSESPLPHTSTVTSNWAAIALVTASTASEAAALKLYGGPSPSLTSATDTEKYLTVDDVEVLDVDDDAVAVEVELDELVTVVVVMVLVDEVVNVEDVVIFSHVHPLG